MKYFVADLAVFKVDTPYLFDKEGHQIYLSRIGDKVYAIADKCPHMHTSLMKGSIEDGIITCKSHGAKINLIDGEILERAHMGFIKLHTRRAKTYEVSIEDEKVFIEIE